MKLFRDCKDGKDDKGRWNGRGERRLKESPLLRDLSPGPFLSRQRRALLLGPFSTSGTIRRMEGEKSGRRWWRRQRVRRDKEVAEQTE